MKKIIFLSLFILTTSLGFTQNLITNGTFDDATGWTVVNQYGTDSTNGSVAISGGQVTIDKIDATDGGWIHMGMYTSVTLTAGFYQFDMDMTFDGINSIWGEVYIGATEPVQNVEYSGDLQVLKAYNAWDCTQTYSGSAVAFGCDDSSPGNFQITADGTYYLLFRTGGATFGDNGIVLDNWSLVADAAQPVANFSESTSESNLEATFTNTSTDATSYSWDFGDGNISADENPVHTYAYKGQYNVTLTATSSEGSNVFSREIFVGAVSTPISEFNFDFSLPTPLRNERLLDYSEANGVATATGVNDDWWSQIKYLHNAGIDLSGEDRGISVEVKGPRTSQLTIKIESGGTEHSVTADYTTPNSWQTLLFDFSSFSSTNNTKIALFFDIQTNFDNTVDPNLNIFQLDNYVFGEFASLGVNDLKMNEATVYPNPTTNFWNISTNNIQIDSVDVFDILGKRVISLQPNTISTTINATNLTTGVYIAKIRTELGTETKKLIKH
jgi:PKD repeat protein